MPHPSSQNNGIDPSVAPSNYFTAYFSFTVGPPLSHSCSLPHTIPCINLFVAHHITSTSSCHILSFHFWSSTPPRSIPFLSISHVVLIPIHTNLRCNLFKMLFFFKESDMYVLWRVSRLLVESTDKPVPLLFSLLFFLTSNCWLCNMRR